jgi:hypothetical protein
VNTGREGPLTVNAGAGEFAADAPRHAKRWSVTFENFVLCKTERAPDIRLQRVRLDTDERTAPLRVVPMLRTFTLKEVESASQHHRGDYAPYLGALLGEPPFNQEYAAGFGGAGEYTAHIDGTKISQTCAETGAAQGALEGGGVPKTPFAELVFVVRADQDGGTIRRAWLDYTADEQPRSLLINWQMTACGRAVQRHCHG